MTTDAPAYAPVPISITANDGTVLTLLRAHLEEVRTDYPDSYDYLDEFLVYRGHGRAVHRATFLLLPGEHGVIATIQPPQRDEAPIYADLFRRYQP